MGKFCHLYKCITYNQSVRTIQANWEIHTFLVIISHALYLERSAKFMLFDRDRDRSLPLH